MTRQHTLYPQIFISYILCKAARCNRHVSIVQGTIKPAIKHTAHRMSTHVQWQLQFCRQYHQPLQQDKLSAGQLFCRTATDCMTSSLMQKDPCRPCCAPRGPPMVPANYKQLLSAECMCWVGTLSTCRYPLAKHPWQTHDTRCTYLLMVCCAAESLFTCVTAALAGSTAYRATCQDRRHWGLVAIR